MQLDDATTILGRADFFTVCDAEQRRLLAFASERKKWRPNSVIYQAGDVPEGAHVLAIVNQAGDSLALNLKAPLVIHISARLGRQIVAKDNHSVQHLLTGVRPFRRTA